MLIVFLEPIYTMYEPCCDLQAREWIDSNVFFAFMYCSTTAKLFKHLLTYLSQKREQSQLWLLFGFSVESYQYTALLKFQSFSLLVPYQDFLDANSSNMILYCTSYLCWDRLINLSTNLADYLYTHLSINEFI